MLRMKHLSKILNLTTTIGAGVFIAFIVCVVCCYFQDPHAKAESYVLDDDKFVSSCDVVDFLYFFQCTHPQYQLIDTDIQGNKYHNFSHAIENRKGQYIVFFYFKDIDMTISCIIGVTSHNHALIKLYAVNNGPIFRHWERINNYKEISRKKNKQVKKKFEYEILNCLGIKWRHKRMLD